jgi:hypothetical protein
MNVRMDSTTNSLLTWRNVVFVGGTGHCKLLILGWDQVLATKWGRA